jgi:hypothetical protein
MIVKDFILTKEIRAMRAKKLRHKKSLRDHAERDWYMGRVVRRGKLIIAPLGASDGILRNHADDLRLKG